MSQKLKRTVRAPPVNDYIFNISIKNLCRHAFDSVPDSSYAVVCSCNNRKFHIYTILIQI